MGSMIHKPLLRRTLTKIQNIDEPATYYRLVLSQREIGAGKAKWMTTKIQQRCTGESSSTLFCVSVARVWLAICPVPALFYGSCDLTELSFLVLFFLFVLFLLWAFPVLDADPQQSLCFALHFYLLLFFYYFSLLFTPFTPHPLPTVTC